MKFTLIINTMKFLQKVRSNMSLLVTKTQFTSGEKFIVTGWYKYTDHVEKNTTKCFVPMQSNRMLFKKGETAPMLGSCEHAIKWEFISAY